MIGYSKRIEKIVQENAFDEKKKRSWLKFNPGLALINLLAFEQLGPGLLDFAIEHVNSVFNLHDWQVRLFWGIQITEEL